MENLMCSSCSTNLLLESNFCHNCGLRVVPNEENYLFENNLASYRAFMIDEQSDVDEKMEYEPPQPQQLVQTWNDLDSNLQELPRSRSHVRCSIPSSNSNRSEKLRLPMLPSSQMATTSANKANELMVRKIPNGNVRTRRSSGFRSIYKGGRKRPCVRIKNYNYNARGGYRSSQQHTDRLNDRGFTPSREERIENLRKLMSNDSMKNQYNKMPVPDSSERLLIRREHESIQVKDERIKPQSNPLPVTKAKLMNRIVFNTYDETFAVQNKNGGHPDKDEYNRRFENFFDKPFPQPINTSKRTSRFPSENLPRVFNESPKKRTIFSRKASSLPMNRSPNVGVRNRNERKPKNSKTAPYPPIHVPKRYNFY
ncbi:hypothetical protein ACOME3_009547 [Neoechinorhynchus agilis]